MSRELIVVKPGLLKPRQKKALEEQGTIIVETDNVNDIRRLSLEPNTVVSGDEMTVAVIESVINGPAPGTAIVVLSAIAEIIRKRLPDPPAALPVNTKEEAS